MGTRKPSNSPIRWLLIEPAGVVELRRGERGLDGRHTNIPASSGLWKAAQTLLREIEEAIERGELK